MKRLTPLLLAMVCSAVGAVNVGPLTKTYTNNEKTGSITIQNTSNTAETYQITVCQMVVTNGERSCTPTSNVVFAPSVVTIGAGKTQTGRFVKRTQSPQEEVYLVRVQQLKDPNSTGFQQLKAMAFPWMWRSLDAKPVLQARWDKDELVVTNTGNATAQLTGLQVGDFTKQGLLGSVMPQEVHRFPLKDAPRGQAVRVNVNGQPVELSTR